MKTNEKKATNFKLHFLLFSVRGFNSDFLKLTVSSFVGDPETTHGFIHVRAAGFCLYLALRISKSKYK